MGNRAAIAMACVVVACGGGDSGVDAGLDGAMADTMATPVDANHPQDVSIDAADVGTDAPLSPDDPGWERLPGFPDACFVERARQPEAVLAYHWEPCLDDLRDCEMAIVERSIAPLEGPIGLSGGNDGRGAIQWHLVDRVLTRTDYVAISRDDVVVAAWREVGSRNCTPGLVASSGGLGIYNFYGLDGGGSIDHVAVAPWDNLARADAPVWTATPDVIPTTAFLQEPSVSATTFAAAATSGEIVAVEPPLGVVLGIGGGPVAVGRSVLWNWGDETDATGIQISRIGDAETELYRAPPGTHVYGVRADGRWIAWRGGADDPTGAHFPLNELWAAPYRETPPLEARRLWTDLVNSGRSGTIGDGMFAHLGADESGTRAAVHVVDLADGSRRRYALPVDSSPGGIQWGFSTDPAWVTRDEVVFPAARSEGTARLRTVLRIDLRGLPVEPLP